MVEIANALIAAAPGFRVRARGKHVEIPKNPLFSSLSRQQLRLVLPHVKFKKYKHGRVLLGEGANNPGKIYIILDGQISIMKQGVSPMESRPEDYELATLRRGEIFGEVSFVDGKPSSVSFQAKTDVESGDCRSQRVTAQANRSQGSRNRRRKAAWAYRETSPRVRWLCA